MWVFDTQEEAAAAAERFSNAAVTANLAGKAQFLYAAEARAHPDARSPFMLLREIHRVFLSFLCQGFNNHSLPGSRTKNRNRQIISDTASHHIVSGY
jgi:hypothetical protein